ncbi:acyl transferase 5-like [Aristolochia californica]|uniref:acyl transferase 5-like n=1 Tax=Aristolochia californica TaxID=171875 RepID=UPI0035D69F72
MSLNFSVVKSAGAMVSPAQPTPPGELSLSVIDQLPGLRRKVQTLHFFRHGENAAEVIRAAIAKALVYYYPLAGRLRESGPGEVLVECTREGIWLVEASVECSLEAADLIDGNCERTLLFELLPHPPMEKDGFDPLVLMQVTSFACNGYVIGLEFSHVICDGLGAAQFLGAVAEFSRGLDRPSIEPAWGREALPQTRMLSITAPPLPPLPFPDQRLEQATVDVLPQRIDELKQEFHRQTGETCSTFEVLTANIWKSRTEAISMDVGKDAEVLLVFFANVRPQVHPPLPKGFYGNCFFPVNVEAPAGKITEGSLADVVKLIKEAKSRLPDEFAKWVARKDATSSSVDPFLPPLSYVTLFVTEWARLGFGAIDYGWGLPAYVMPIQYTNVVPGCVVASPPTPQKGVRLITWCVQEEHLPAFRNGLVKPDRKGDHPVFSVHDEKEQLN